tara:strand:- start:2810 stop:4105 length:1296 start_codon:yes stop_codon:yes gene_type:complete
MILTAKQTKALDILEDKTTNTLLFGGGAGGGKSVLGCYWILKNCLKYKKTRWIIGRAKLKILKETTLNTLFEVMNIQGITVDHYKYNSTSSSFLFYHTQSEIILKDLYYYPSDPDYTALGGIEITGAFIDEAAEVNQKAYQILSSRIRYKLDTHNLVPKILMTCNPSKNWLYNEFYKLDKENKLPENKKFLKSLVTDNPSISKHYIKQLKTLDKISKERLLYGNWEYDDDDTKLFIYDKILDSFSNQYVSGGDYYLTIDVARFGKDKSVVCCWNGYRCEYIQTYSKISLTELAKNVNEIARKNKVPRSQIIIDEDGVGGGLVDMINGCKGFVNNSKALDGENYSNLRCQCYYKFAEKINKGEVYITPNEHKDLIVQELEVIQMKDIDKDNKLSIIGKDKIKEYIGRSPDFADALMMRIYGELNKTRITYFG